MLLAWLLAQQDPATGFTARDIIGPYGALVGAVIVCGVLSRMVASRDKQLEAADERERALYDRVIDVTGGAATMLEHNTQTLERTVRLLERIEQKL